MAAALYCRDSQCNRVCATRCDASVSETSRLPLVYVPLSLFNILYLSYLHIYSGYSPLLQHRMDPIVEFNVLGMDAGHLVSCLCERG